MLVTHALRYPSCMFRAAFDTTDPYGPCTVCSKPLADRPWRVVNHSVGAHEECRHKVPAEVAPPCPRDARHRVLPGNLTPDRRRRWWCFGCDAEVFHTQPKRTAPDNV